MTVVTGLMDAASYVNLGHVFAANMTGDVVFLGFAALAAGAASGYLGALVGALAWT